jgi:hypothetical protein
MATKKQTQPSLKPIGQEQSSRKDSKAAVLKHAANELAFGIVGHVGAGTSTIANVLADLPGSSSLPGGYYQTEILSAREAIENWATTNLKPLPTTNATAVSPLVKCAPCPHCRKEQQPWLTAAN